MTAAPRSLVPHPDSPAGPVRTLQVKAERQGTALALHYVLDGRLSEILLPPRAKSARADELWKHTCFEAFVRVPGDEAYWEFNLAPSTQWAAYGFTSYRKRGADPQTAPPRIEIRTAPRLELSTRLDLSLLKGPWQVALSAVVEGRDGQRAYWALKHPPGGPDFHHSAGFVLDLPLP